MESLLDPERERGEEPCVGPLTWTRFTAETLGYARRLVRGSGRPLEDAEDLIHDLYGRLISRNIDWSDDPDTAGAYARRALLNLYIDEERARRSRAARVPTLPMERTHEQVAAPGPSVASQAIAFELRQELVRAIRSLPPGQHAVIMAALEWERGALDRASHAEMATEMGVSEDASRQRLLAARHTLMEALAHLRREGGYT